MDRFERAEIKTDRNVSHVEICFGRSVEALYPFLYQPIRTEYDSEGIEHISNDGEPYSCVRFTPRECGEYKLRFFAGERIIAEDTFTVTESACHGYIRVSEKDKRYFEYSDGSPFTLIGMNMSFPGTYEVTSGYEFSGSGSFAYVGLRQYERWFKQASENGINMVRLWIGHPYFSPDTENVYSLDLQKFSVIDEAVKLAKKYGLTLKLTIENFRYFNYDRAADTNSYSDDIFRKFNKKIYADGKRCESMEEWITDPKYADAWLYKVKELAKRYSGDTAVFAVELWNEMNAIDCPYEKTVEWNKKYLPEVSKLFPHNMVINSLGSFDSDEVLKLYNGFCWDKGAFKQVHRYLDLGAPYKVCHQNPIEFSEDAYKKLGNPDMPIIFAETGAVNNCHSGPFKFYMNDHDGLIFADCVYTPFFAGFAGCGHIWHWDERYVEAKNLYRMYKPFAELVKGIDTAAEAFEAQSLSNEEAYVLVLKGRTCVLGYIRNRAADWKNILRDLSTPKIIDKLTLSFESIKSIKLYNIWEENIEVNKGDSTAEFKNICKGCMFKIELNS